MTSARRNPLTGDQPVHVLIIAGCSGILAALSGARPTDIVVVDVVLAAMTAGFVTWAAATAPWWAIAASAGVAAAFSSSVLFIAVAMVAGLAELFIGARRRNLPLVRTIAALAIIQVLFRMGSVGFLGLSAIVGGATLASLGFLGVRRRPSEQRKRVWLTAGLVAGLATIAVGGLAIAGLSARAPLQEATRRAERGLDLLNAGDIPAAATAFAASADAFDEASNDLTALYAQPSRLLPAVSQNRQAAVDLASAGAAAMRTAANSLSQVDPETLRVVNGAIDLDAVRSLTAPFTAMASAIGDIQEELADLKSPWLAGPLTTRVDRLSLDLVKNRIRVDNAVLATQLAPKMLGGEGARRYFIAFTTPAEARGLGGFMGNWAELTIDQGRLSLTNFGRHTDLNTGGSDLDARTITGPKDLVDRWGPLGLLEPDGTTTANPWTFITMPPDFPLVAEAIAELYPQSGGRPIDGAFVMDTSALAALVSITGPLDVEGVEQPLNSDNLIQFILRDQYLIGDNAQRIDLLDVIAQTAMNRILTSALPPPAELGQIFGPLTQTGHLSAWSAQADEQELFTRLRMDGAFPRLDGRDGVAVTIDGGNSSKIDAYAEVDIRYKVSRQPTGQARGEIELTLTNNAPSSGLPNYVIGNARGQPLGTNRMFVSIYTALPVVSATMGGESLPLLVGAFFDWNAASSFVDVPSGETRTILIRLEGLLTEADEEIVTRMQPMAGAD